MKKIQKSIFGLLLSVTIFSCSKDNSNTTLNGPTNANLIAVRADNKINVATLPQVILDFITLNYPNLTILKTDIEKNKNYEVTLSNKVEVIFNTNGTFLGIDDDETEDYGDIDINPEDLPQVILDYILVNYPNEIIDDAELENNDNYEIELNNNVVLVFNANGTFLGVGVDEDNQDGDNHENDQVIDPATLPQIILNYISANYPSDVILQAKIESDGNYEVTLSTGLEILFDTNGIFLGTGNGDDDGDGQGD
jgi:hypothetical protein